MQQTIQTQRSPQDALYQILVKLLMGTGASRVLIALRDKDRYYVHGHLEDGVVSLQQVKLEDRFSTLSESIVTAVIKEQQAIIMDDQLFRRLQATDPYIKLYQPRSLMCLPAINKGVPIGFVYLENRLLEQVFHQHQVTLYHAMVQQAIIYFDYTNKQSKGRIDITQKDTNEQLNDDQRIDQHTETDELQTQKNATRTKNLDFVAAYIDEICYIKSIKNYVIIKGPNKRFENQMLLLTLKEIHNHFPDTFIRPRRSCLVVIKNILEIVQNKKGVWDIVAGEYLIPISRHYFKKINEDHTYLFKQN